MKLNTKMKSALIALPLMLLVGCSSSSTDNGVDDGSSGVGYPGMTNNGSGNGLGDQATLDQLKENNTVFFDFDRYDVKPQFAQELNYHAEFLRKNASFSITVEGHADERGTPEYNIALGERRANAVKMYLQGRGVPTKQIYVVSYGKEKPAVLGHDESAYSQNRRAVIVY